MIFLLYFIFHTSRFIEFFRNLHCLLFSWCKSDKQRPDFFDCMAVQKTLLPFIAFQGKTKGLLSAFHSQQEMKEPFLLLGSLTNDTLDPLVGN